MEEAGALAPALTCTFFGGGGPIPALTTTRLPAVMVDATLVLGD